MIRSRGRRTQLGVLLAMALGAVAIFVLPGLASAKDSNGDRIPDRWETRHHLSLTVNQSGRDQDGDHLRNRGEFRAGDNPRDRDSDDDGVMDGNENAGTIQSFDAASGKLVIALFGSETISGLVTAQTKIKCEDEHSSSSTVTANRSHSGEAEPGDDHGGHGEAEPGDDHGGHGAEPGDDNGGHGNEPGDDNGGDNSGPGSSNSGPSGHDDNGVGANCTTADLTVGAVVQEADLELEHGSATFDEVELAR
jgi:hypothetical protein